MTWEGLSPPYATIVADPPWPYAKREIEWGRERGDVSGEMPYTTMTVPEIACLPVVDLAAPSAHLYLWTTNAHVWAARDVAIGWGFEPVQLLTWCKPPAGLKPGGAFSPTTEFIVYARRTIKQKRTVERAGRLIADARNAARLNRSQLHRLVRGGTPTGIVTRWEDNDCLPNERDWDRLQEVLPALSGVDRPAVDPPPPREVPRAESSWWLWPVGRHSEKPDAFLDIVEQVSPSPRVELFARQPRLGWDHWGHGYEGVA